MLSGSDNKTNTRGREAPGAAAGEGVGGVGLEGLVRQEARRHQEVVQRDPRRGRDGSDPTLRDG